MKKEYLPNSGACAKKIIFKENKYIQNAIVYLLITDKLGEDNADDNDDCQSHYVYIKKIAHLLNLSHDHSGKNHRYCPMCEKLNIIKRI